MPADRPTSQNRCQNGIRDRDLGIHAGVVRPGADVIQRKINAHRVEMHLPQHLLRERVTQRNVFQPQVGAVLYDTTGVFVYALGINSRDVAVRVRSAS